MLMLRLLCNSTLVCKRFSEFKVPVCLAQRSKRPASTSGSQPWRAACLQDIRNVSWSLDTQENPVILSLLRRLTNHGLIFWRSMGLMGFLWGMTGRFVFLCTICKHYIILKSILGELHNYRKRRLSWVDQYEKLKGSVQIQALNHKADRTWLS